MDNLNVEHMREVRALILRERARILDEGRITCERLAEVVDEINIEIAVRHGLAELVLAHFRQLGDV